MVIVLASLIGVAGQVHGSGSNTALDLKEQLVMATLWIQTSAEFRALCYQSFNLAKMNLDLFLSSYAGSKPVAVKWMQMERCSTTRPMRRFSSAMILDTLPKHGRPGWRLLGQRLSRVHWRS